MSGAGGNDTIPSSNEIPPFVLTPPNVVALPAFHLGEADEAVAGKAEAETWRRKKAERAAS